MNFNVTATVCVKEETKAGTLFLLRQVPAFSLNNISCKEEAEKIAKEIINPLNNPKLTTDVCAEPV